MLREEIRGVKQNCRRGGEPRCAEGSKSPKISPLNRVPPPGFAVFRDLISQPRYITTPVLKERRRKRKIEAGELQPPSPGTVQAKLRAKSVLTPEKARKSLPVAELNFRVQKVEVCTARHRRGVKMAKKIPPKSGSPGGKWHFFGVQFWGGGMTGRAHFYLR